MASDRLAGSLMCAGAALGLIATPLSVPALFPFGLFPFSLLSWVSFGLIFIAGVKVARGRHEGPILAAATLWFATVGGLPFLWVIGLSSWLGFSFLPGFAFGLLGTAIAIAGAGLKLTEWQHGPARHLPPRLFERTAWLLGAGSFAFLVAAAPSYSGLASSGYGELMWRTTLIVVGLWLHLVAWVTLFGATMDGFGEGTASRTLNWGRLAWTVSVISFVVAVFVAPILDSFIRGWFPFVSPMFPLLFPYYPAVFAPVVLAHGFIFRGYSRFLKEGARKIVWIGVLALAVAATVGLVGQSAAFAQVSLPSEVYWWILLPFPAGSTAIGYGLIFYGWRRGTPVEQDGLSDNRDASQAVPR